MIYFFNGIVRFFRSFESSIAILPLESFLCGAIKDILTTQIAATTFIFYQAVKISSECQHHMVIS